MEIDRAQFRQYGYCTTSNVLDPPDIDYLGAIEYASEKLAASNQGKNLWMHDPEIRRMATRENIVEPLRELFAPHGFFLWGARIVDRGPDDVHPWHCDLETLDEGFISLWIAIDGAEGTQFQLIPGSHRLDSPVQAHFAWGHEARADPGGSEILRTARELGLQAELEKIQCTPGQGILFDGRTWHATHHEGRHRRRALLLQYGRHGKAVFQYPDRRKFPLDRGDGMRTPVLSLGGPADPVSNKTWRLGNSGQVTAPSASTFAAPSLPTRPERVWTRHPYFDTETPVLSHLECHASVLKPGAMPHLPHQHDEEELLIILSGKAGILTKGNAGDMWRTRPAGPGNVFYYPAEYSHTIFNWSRDNEGLPLAYLMFRWKARDAEARPARPFRIPGQAVMGEKRVVVNRPSTGLGKIHVHTRRLLPGQKFPTGIDRYCTAILVLQGELTVLNKTLGPYGVFLTRAGELHNTANTSEQPNHYLVFEFHARES